MLSKLENQEMILDKKEYRIDEQIRMAILMLESKWSAKNIEFELDLPKQLYFGSEQLMGQIWINIIDNAIKHSPDGGVIEINMYKENDMLQVSVTDHGDGISG